MSTKTKKEAVSSALVQKDNLTVANSKKVRKPKDVTNKKIRIITDYLCYSD